MVLQALVLARIDLASQTGRLAGGSGLPGDVVLLQEIQLALADPDSTSIDAYTLASIGGDHATEASAVSQNAGGAEHPCFPSTTRPFPRFGWRVAKLQLLLTPLIVYSPRQVSVRARRHALFFPQRW